MPFAEPDWRFIPTIPVGKPQLCRRASSKSRPNRSGKKSKSGDESTPPYRARKSGGRRSGAHHLLQLLRANIGPDQFAAVLRPGHTARHSGNTSRAHTTESTDRSGHVSNGKNAFPFPGRIVSLSIASLARPMGEKTAAAGRSYHFQLWLCKREFRMGAEAWRENISRRRQFTSGTIL